MGRGGERVALEMKFKEHLSANSDDLSTFLQLSSELCRKGRDGNKSQVEFKVQVPSMQ